MYGNQTNLAQSDQKELLIDFYYRMKDKGKKRISFRKIQRIRITVLNLRKTSIHQSFLSHEFICNIKIAI